MYTLISRVCFGSVLSTLPGFGISVFRYRFDPRSPNTALDRAACCKLGCSVSVSVGWVKQIVHIIIHMNINDQSKHIGRLGIPIDLPSNRSCEPSLIPVLYLPVSVNETLLSLEPWPCKPAAKLLSSP